VDGERFDDALARAVAGAGVGSEAELPATALRDLVAEVKAIVTESAGIPFPDEPGAQRRAAIEAVFRSWNGKRAQDYRRHEGSPDDLGTAVNVQAMVFGNKGDDSGTGVAFTRD